MKTNLRLAVLLSAAIFCPAMTGVAGQGESASGGPIACRVLEAHAAARPSAAVVIFHQQNKADQAQLATLLREHSGESVEFRVGDGPWTGGTMFRLKSCFGRGMLLLPSETTMEDGATFVLRVLPRAADH